MRCIDLSTDTLKILGTHFSCNEKLREEKNFYKIVTDMQRFGKKPSPLCSFCNSQRNTLSYIF